MLQDATNGVFEIVGGILTWLNVKKLKKDKRVMGVYIPVWIFFTVWGFWNLYYYPFLNQWYSFVGALLLSTGNCVWVMLALYYSRRGGKNG